MSTADTQAKAEPQLPLDISLNFQPAYPPLQLSTPLAYKAQHEDFIVEEQLGFSPSGEGEHLFLYVEKINLNTEQLAGFLAKALGVLKRDIGLSGQKDKFALTRQWFSVPFPIKNDLPDLDSLRGEGWQVLSLQRHDRKLKRGVHKANRFHLRLKSQAALQLDDWQQIETRLQQVLKTGFANYFGEQRFGYQGRNVDKAHALLTGRFKCKKHQRSMYFSAARSYCFNHYLSKRIAAGLWQTPLDGDLFQIEGSASFFSDTISDDLITRFNHAEIHPMAPLLGKMNRQLEDFSSSAAGEFLHNQDADFNWQQALAKAGLNTQFRALRVMPSGLSVEQSDVNTIALSFDLPRGAFATSLLQELSAQNYLTLDNMP